MTTGATEMAAAAAGCLRLWLALRGRVRRGVTAGAKRHRRVVPVDPLYSNESRTDFSDRPRRIIRPSRRRRPIPGVDGRRSSEYHLTIHCFRKCYRSRRRSRRPRF